MGVAGQPEPGKATRNIWRDVAVRLGGLAGVAIVLWLLFTRLVSWSDVADAIAGLDNGDWALLIIISVIRVAIEPLLLMASTPKLRWPKALPGFLAPAAAASVVPGPSDLAARYAMFRSWGYSGAQTSASVILVFLYTTFAKVALPVVAAVVFVAFGRSNAQLETLAVIAGGILVGGVFLVFLLLRSEGTARRLGNAAGVAARRVASWFRITTPETLAADLADRAAHFRDRTGDVVRTRTHLAAGAAALGQAALFAILLVSVRVVDIRSDELDWVSVFAAFALVQLLTSVPITPSGLGVAEAAYVAILTAESNAGLAGQIAAAAIIYRLFSWVLLVPLGALSWLWWSRTRRNSTEDSPEAMP
ncbi:MAG: lysylphosphatidylglycerol synthase domain-containing protein [Acidimicrobiia bacterium]|nr:lysylphosphatidylglycerol synthase domain-containing protein [Acidimicrobiia bacterium]